MTDAPAAGRSGDVLILVDIQPDFLPGGALTVGGGDEILEPVAHLMGDGPFGLQIATQDWHPPTHVSFASRHSGKEPMDAIELHGHEQTLWPDHCVQGTPGAELQPDLPWTNVEAVIRKGTDPESDSYSGFRNNWNADGGVPPQASPATCANAASSVSSCAGSRGTSACAGRPKTRPTPGSRPTCSGT